MKTLLLKNPLKYDGRQLSSHFAYKNHGILGNSIVAFCGPVVVDLSEMVDIEDVLNKEPIASDEMLNFIVEVFDLNLHGTVWMQRLLMATIQEEINSRLNAYAVTRDGDDLYYQGRKLSVSIATASPVSTMIHSALNIRGTGAPIPISCLSEMAVDADTLAEVVMKRFSAEFQSVEDARMKVNWIS